MAQGFGLRKIDFDPDYAEIVEKKQQEFERITQEQYIAEQAVYKKQARITEAEGEAQIVKIMTLAEAEAAAEATLTKAKAQAEANRLLAQSLTPALVQWQALTEWNGVMPLFIGGGESVILPPEIFATGVLTSTRAVP